MDCAEQESNSGLSKLTENKHWCGREDSNFHGVTPTNTSSLRVYHSATTASSFGGGIADHLAGINVPLLGVNPPYPVTDLTVSPSPIDHCAAQRSNVRAKR